MYLAGAFKKLNEQMYKIKMYIDWLKTLYYNFSVKNSEWFFSVFCCFISVPVAQW